MDIILENKVVEKLKFEKLSITKNELVNDVLNSVGKIRKIRIIFDIKNSF